MSEAQTHFYEILSLAVEGAEIILTEDNKPVARLVAFGAPDAPSASRVAGLHNGAIWISTNLCQTNSGLVLNENPTGYSRQVALVNHGVPSVRSSPAKNTLQSP